MQPKRYTVYKWKMEGITTWILVIIILHKRCWWWWRCCFIIFSFYLLWIMLVFFHSSIHPSIVGLLQIHSLNYAHSFTLIILLFYRLPPTPHAINSFLHSPFKPWILFAQYKFNNQTMVWKWHAFFSSSSLSLLLLLFVFVLRLLKVLVFGWVTFVLFCYYIEPSGRI